MTDTHEPCASASFDVEAFRKVAELVDPINPRLARDMVASCDEIETLRDVICRNAFDGSGAVKEAMIRAVMERDAALARLEHLAFGLKAAHKHCDWDAVEAAIDALAAYDAATPEEKEGRK